MSSMVAVNIITTLDVCTFLFIVSAMKRIEEIKSKRQDQFIKNRLVQTIVCITGRLWWENQCYVVLLSFISECLTRSSGIKGQAPHISGCSARDRSDLLLKELQNKTIKTNEQTESLDVFQTRWKFSTQYSSLNFLLDCESIFEFHGSSSEWNACLIWLTNLCRV